MANISEQQRIEIKEAIAAGERAMVALNQAESSLSTARGMGVWDMLGGGIISGLLKHSNMDKAQDYMEQAERELRNFQRELNDVQMRCEVRINFDELSRLADYFFDNFLVDAMIQSRIKDSQRQVAQIKYQVQGTIDRLRQMLEY